MITILGQFICWIPVIRFARGKTVLVVCLIKCMANYDVIRISLTNLNFEKLRSIIRYRKPKRGSSNGRAAVSHLEVSGLNLCSKSYETDFKYSNYLFEYSWLKTTKFWLQCRILIPPFCCLHWPGAKCKIQTFFFFFFFFWVRHQGPGPR